MNRVLSKTARAGSAKLEESLYRTEFDLEPRKNAYYYKYEIGKLARQGGTGIHKAVELFQEMKSKARLTPECTHFSPLIYGCAKSGHTKKAFELYEESFKYIKTPSNPIITCLLNACAESPFPEYGLKRLDWLLAHLKVNYTSKSLNEIHYNAAIKAYGKLGNLEEASKLIQEMINNQVLPTTDTFNSLLIGCASNKQAGSAIALRVIKRMKMYDLKPDLVTYRLMLRCVRDCGLGSTKLIEETLSELPAISSIDQRLKYKKSTNRNSSKSFRDDFVWAPLITELGSYIAKAVKDVDKGTHVPVKFQENGKGERVMAVMDSNEELADAIIAKPDADNNKPPNLLSDDHLNLMMRIKGIRLDQLNDAAGRLELFGGLQGYLETMLRDGCKPDNKTFSLLLKCFKPSRENFLSYHELTKRFNIDRDRLYYDLLIERVNRTGTGSDLALDFLEQMHADGLRPNITTFESLAGGCRTWKEAERLISDLDALGSVISDKMIREFFYIAAHRRNFSYLNRLIKLSEKRNFKPTDVLVDKLEDCRLDAQELILKQEHGKLDITKGDRLYNEREIKSYDLFKSRLNKWLRRVKLQEEEHPWTQMEEQCKREPSREWQSSFVEHFKALNLAKLEALAKGGPIGNLDYKSREIKDQSSNK